MESIKNRTSIRKYADKEVTDELLNQLLEEAMRTPTMGNLQLYSVVVTRSEKPQGYSGIRQHPLVHECGYRCPALHADIHQPGRRGWFGNLLPGHHGVYAKDDHPHPEAP